MDDKKGTAAVLTGSTGNPYVDMPFRTAWVLFVGHVAAIASATAGANPWLTGEITAMAGTGAILSWGLFDGIIRPRL